MGEEEVHGGVEAGNHPSQHHNPNVPHQSDNVNQQKQPKKKSLRTRAVCNSQEDEFGLCVISPHDQMLPAEAKGRTISKRLKPSSFSFGPYFSLSVYPQFNYRTLVYSAVVSKLKLYMLFVFQLWYLEKNKDLKQPKHPFFVLCLDT